MSLWNLCKVRIISHITYKKLMSIRFPTSEGKKVSSLNATFLWHMLETQKSNKYIYKAVSFPRIPISDGMEAISFSSMLLRKHVRNTTQRKSTYSVTNCKFLPISVGTTRIWFSCTNLLHTCEGVYIERKYNYKEDRSATSPICVGRDVMRLIRTSLLCTWVLNRSVIYRTHK